MFTILFAIIEHKHKKAGYGKTGRSKGNGVMLYVGLALDVFCFIIAFMCLYQNGIIKL